MTTEQRLAKVEREPGRAKHRRLKWYECRWGCMAVVFLVTILLTLLVTIILVARVAASEAQAGAQDAALWRTIRANVPFIPTPGFSQVPAESVARIIDGDTITVVRSGREVTVRLIGVDTPETVHPSKPVEAYGKEASRFTTNLLKGEKVYLVRDPTSAETFDRYGRLLAFVYRAPDGLFVNAEIVRQGYGHAYIRYPFRYMVEFRALERFAREAGKGLWGRGEPAAATAPRSAPPRPRICPLCKGLGRIGTSGPLIRMTRRCPACKGTGKSPLGIAPRTRR